MKSSSFSSYSPPLYDDHNHYYYSLNDDLFQEWLRSLPDCLLMSRLYPQWIDVAKLIEPLHQHQQQQSSQLKSTELDNDVDSFSDNTMSSGIRSLRPSSTSTSTSNSSSSCDRSPLTDNGGTLLNRHQNNHHHNHQQLDRARSCSTTMITSTTTDQFGSISAINGNGNQPNQSETTTTNRNRNKITSSTSWSAFALSERHSECLRIVRQLLDSLNEANLILLSSFISVLWHIANNSEENKMSAANLGVCVGQSLLNDEHQYSGNGVAAINGCSGSQSSTFAKRHRRTRSHCLLSSTLSLSSTPSSNLLAQAGYLDSSEAQETAKYVPMLVAFMIDNATALFGPDITNLFTTSEKSISSSTIQKCVTKTGADTMVTPAAADAKKMVQMDLCDSTRNDCEQQQQQQSRLDQVDHSSPSSTVCSSLDADVQDATTITPIKRVSSAGLKVRQQIVIESRSSLSDDSAIETSPKGSACNITSSSATCSPTSSVSITSEMAELVEANNHHHHLVGHYHNHHHHHQQQQHDKNSETTSIVIVNNNPPKRNQQQQVVGGQQQQPVELPAQHRPLSATESTTSSSRASSSTSGVHSESPAFSSELDSHNGRTIASSSPSSAVSSPSSSSPVSSPVDGGASSSSSQEEEATTVNQAGSGTKAKSAAVVESQLSDCNDDICSSDRTKSHHLLHQHQRHHRPLSGQLSAPEPCMRASESAVAATTLSRQYQNRHMMNRYSTFMGVLNRVPKIPVQFTTSSYGGEAIIYNPRPTRHHNQPPPPPPPLQQQQQQLVDSSTMDGPQKEAEAGKQEQQQLTNDHRLSIHSVASALELSQEASFDSNSPNDSVISVKPLQVQQQPVYGGAIGLPASQAPHTNQQHQQGLKEQRINEFLAHQHHHQRQQQQHYLQRISLPYLQPPHSNYIVSRQQQQQRHNSLAPAMSSTPAMMHQQAAAAQQQQQHPVFYAPSNLNSLQQLLQQDRYMMYHRASLQPQRSHVMSLRDYYLSLQQQNQQRQRMQQQYTPFVNRPKQQSHPSLSSHHQSSQHHQQQRVIMAAAAQRQYLATDGSSSSKSSLGAQAAAEAAAMVKQGAKQQQQQQQLTTHQPPLMRPQPRLAKIRQNQFNGSNAAGIYVNGISSPLLVSAPTNTNLAAAAAKLAVNSEEDKIVVVNPNIKLASSSDNNNSSGNDDDDDDDDSDEYMNDWRESTMV